MTIYQVLIISAREIMREGLAQAIRRCPAFRLGTAVTSPSNLSLLPERFVPDLIVLDGQAVQRTVHETVAPLLAGWPGASVLLLVPQGPAVKWGPGLAGVCKAVPEGVPITELVTELLRLVGDEAGYLEPQVPSGPGRGRAGHLTAREQEVLELLAEGRANKEIAELLGLRELTVKSHLKEIYSKLQVQNRVEAAMAWRQMVAL